MDDCPICRSITERSALYERWLHAENHGDSASLQAIAAARGFCSIHARRLLDRDSDIAGAIASFVLQMICAHLDRQQRDRRGYRDALEPSRLCSWCATEFEALDYALSDRKRISGTLCAPHARAAMVAERQPLHIGSPLLAGASLAPPVVAAPAAASHAWWSQVVRELWETLRRSCAACDAAREAGEQREEFLRGGPRSHEHWEIPTLCVAHDAALGKPRTDAYVRTPDRIDRECDWCSVMYRAAERTARLFATAFCDPNFRLAYASVPGLCLPHCAAVMHQLPEAERDAFCTAVRVRVDAMAWELEERAARRSWQLRDQRSLSQAETLSHRAWWLISGGVFRAQKSATR